MAESHLGRPDGYGDVAVVLPREGVSGCCFSSFFSVFLFLFLFCLLPTFFDASTHLYKRSSVRQSVHLSDRPSV